MRIEVKGRNLPVNDELREHVEKRFQKIAKQVSDLAVLEIEVSQGAQPGQPGVHGGRGDAHLKGVTLRAKDASRDLNHSVNLVAEELGRQVKRHRDKRRKRREQRAAAAAPQLPPDAAGGQLPADVAPGARPGPYTGCHDDPRSRPAHGRGQAVQAVRQARGPHQRLGARARAPGGRGAAPAGRQPARARAQRRGSSTTCCPRRSRSCARSSRRTHGHAPLRRPDDRRHGAARRRDRRDEDRRGQDADRHARRRAQRARRRGRPRRHRQRLPRPPRRRVDEPDLPRARPHRRRAAEHAALRGEARRLRRRHHLRHQLRVRLRLPARQHGRLARGEGPARRALHRGGQAALLPPLRDRRRGRQHPHRRGPHAADHLRRPRAGRRPLRPLRQARARA